jgi:hypothetical protein
MGAKSKNTKPLDFSIIASNSTEKFMREAGEIMKQGRGENRGALTGRQSPLTTKSERTRANKGRIWY